VAARHYATSIDLDADFKRAAAVPDGATQKAAHSLRAEACTGAHGETGDSQKPRKTSSKHGVTLRRTSVHRSRMGGTGLEPVTSSL
jgi:hypothetical protein